MKRIYAYRDDQYIWGIYVYRGRMSTDLVMAFARYRFKIVLKPYIPM
jgi:hypothetical protein